MSRDPNAFSRLGTYVILSAVVLMLTESLNFDCYEALNKGHGSIGTEPKQIYGGDRMRLEHVAINVGNPVAMAKWYCENLGMKIVRKGPAPVNAHFICDAQENMMLEIYLNPPDAVPDYASMNPLVFHIAFMVNDVKGVCRKLVAAGAKIVEDVSTTPDGDEFAILRDPWGISIQFVKRAESMLSND